MTTDRQLYERQRDDLIAQERGRSASLFLAWPRGRALPEQVAHWLAGDGFEVVAYVNGRDKQGVFVRRPRLEVP